MSGQTLAELLTAEGMCSHSWRCAEKERFPDYCHCAETGASLIVEWFREQMLSDEGVRTAMPSQWGIGAGGLTRLILTTALDWIAAIR